MEREKRVRKCPKLYVTHVNTFLQALYIYTVYQIKILSHHSVNDVDGGGDGGDDVFFTVP